MDIHLVKSLPDTLSDRFAAGDPQAAQKNLEQEHVVITGRMLDALVRGDLEAFGAELSPEVTIELHQPPEFPFICYAEGREAAVELVRHNYAQVRDQHPEVLYVSAQGDTVVIIGRERGCLSATGAPYHLHFVHQFTLREGKVRHVLGIAGPSSELHVTSPGD